MAWHAPLFARNSFSLSTHAKQRQDLTKGLANLVGPGGVEHGGRVAGGQPDDGAAGALGSQNPVD